MIDVILFCFRFAGLRNGVQCFCGTIIGAPANETCSVTCKGNSSLLCGGAGAVSVYETGITGKSRLFLCDIKIYSINI